MVESVFDKFGKIIRPYRLNVIVFVITVVNKIG